MEKGEHRAKINYAEIGKFIPDAIQISKEETQHEESLFKMLNSRRLE